MELKWDELPSSSPVPFSKDTFEKFSLAPTIKELWSLLQSPDEVEVKEESKVRPAGSSSKPSKIKNITPQSSSRNSYGSAGSTSDCSDTPADCKMKQNEGFPSPKVPYPCYSAINHKERLAYLRLLKEQKLPHSSTNNKVKNEIAEFMKYLQDVSKVCADDYKYMPLGTPRYLEEYFKACLDYMTNYPQIYCIQEITSLTGGKFVPDISFNVEKQLLAMGNIEMVEKRMLPEETQLYVDYDSVSAGVAPCKKASHFHRAISSDTNAEKLSAIYEPHVCLAKEAFLQLLNNSAGYTEAWELPVWVKENPGKCSSKTVYIDPPLLKTQMTWRERNHLIHEESVKLAYKKTGSNPVFFLLTEDYSNKTNFAPEEKFSRAVVSFDDTSIDFEVDVTELESFGESYQLSKKVKGHDESKALSKNHTLGLSKSKLGSDKHALAGASTPEDISSSSHALPKEEFKDEAAKTDVDDSSTDKSTGDILNAVSEDPVNNSSSVEECSSSECPPTKRIRCNSVYSSDHSMDSDEERLVIDHPGSPLYHVAKKTQMAPPAPESITYGINEQTSDPTTPLSPTGSAKEAKKGKRRSRVSGDCDQLGHILRMQNAMLKSTISKGQEPSKAQTLECRPPEPKLNSHPHSLVKPCVSSYLDSGEGLDEEAATPTICQPTVPKKRLLREELLVSAEDEKDYKAPEEASVLYKLYSLLDVLLMVRSTVDIAHPRHDSGTFSAVPVHVLPKLEYQLCYGAETLTHTEACLLWAEQLLHSSTVSFIGRINAHTSKVVQLQELSVDWIQNTSSDFKPARCLNTLYHILKKVMGLQEGRYLLGHKPGEAVVTIFKASDEKKPSRSIYDLQAVHSGPPGVPLEDKVPWVPLDPFHLMPFHQKYKRPPCTFPPRPPPQRKAGRSKGGKQGNTPTRPTQGTQNSSAVADQSQEKKKRKRRSLQQKQKRAGKVMT
ncbi:little elongation complex subunit 2 isoform X1 [Pygocentrus nattereri]|uniref:Little elongation complex subunit 2 C-terminal domain-containing protein n=2 Tax=Pygocentrus nattereri TaxID=42514 RepID=A0A3B4CC99_PYGNA|nr:little elongation complex subunit 2 isoform X1 [Pygocentrus nattereri]